jgi:ATP-dependent Clp protease ATP-binding subunit ClpX
MDPLERNITFYFNNLKNALIKQYKIILLMDEVIYNHRRSLDFIVDKALEYKLGARGLRSLCEAILTDV